MNLLKSSVTTIILLIVVVILIFSNLKSCSSKRQSEKEHDALIAALADTVKYFENKHGETVAQISTIQAERAKDFVKLKTKDEEIQKLQQIVKDYKNKLQKAGSSVTHTKTETKIDTVTKTEVVIVADTAYPIYRSSFKNKWIDYSVVASVDSTELSLKTYNEYSTIVGYDKKKKKYFTDVITASPYDSIKSTRTYQTSMPKQKSWNVSIGGGYGLTQDGLRWMIGIYAGKTILRL